MSGVLVMRNGLNGEQELHEFWKWLDGQLSFPP